MSAFDLHAIPGFWYGGMVDDRTVSVAVDPDKVKEATAYFRSLRIRFQCMGEARYCGTRFRLILKKQPAQRRLSLD